MQKEALDCKISLLKAQKLLDEQQEIQTSQLSKLEQEKEVSLHLTSCLHSCQTALEQTESKLTVVQSELQNLKSGSEYEQLLATQNQLEIMRAQLLFEKQELTEQQSALQLRVKALENEQTELRKYQDEVKDLEQVKKSLQESQDHLANREAEWQSRQEQADKSYASLVKAKQAVTEKAELLAAQIEIFEKRGLPPKEKAYQHLLADTKRMINSKHIHKPTCFISYAWEDIKTPDGKQANEKLQSWLALLERDLNKLGLKVFFDVSSMHGNMREKMRRNIEGSDFFFLVGTQRFKQCVEMGLTADVKDIISLNKKGELRAAIEKLKESDTTTPEYKAVDPTTNVAFEFMHIWDKILANPDALIPILFTGDYNTSFPPKIFEHLIFDARESKQISYHSLMTALQNPIGIIPLLFQHSSVEFRRDYKVIVERFELAVSDIEAALKLAVHKII